MRYKILAAALVGASLIWPGGVALAQEITLKLHQFLPAESTVPAEFLMPWAQKVEKESNGRIHIEHYPAMQLGGEPRSLIDQVTDGEVDLAWTVLGYTPGRFPRAQAFELPFMVTNAEDSSKAFWEYYQGQMRGEFPGLKVIAVHTHGPGLLHTREPVSSLDDVEDLKLSSPTRLSTTLLSALGAVAVGMPISHIPQALSDGDIDGALLPWEVIAPLKITEQVNNHTGLSGSQGLYTATFIFAMNQGSYDALPDDLKQVIDNNSGLQAAAWAGRVMDSGDQSGRSRAREAGDNVFTLNPAETARWREAAGPMVDEWVARMNDEGFDGQALLDEARRLIDLHSM